MKTQSVLLAIAILTIAFVSCSKKDISGGNARLVVALTDGPGDFEVVNIDVQDVRINYSGDNEKGWISLAGVKTGSYDILRLANGKDTILADAHITAGKIQQIRLVLGPDNFVIVGGKRYDLKTPSAEQSGLKLKISQEVNEGITYKILMDFDASRSIVKTGNGKFNLKPVIRTSLEAIGGSIKGQVTPGSFTTAVYAIQGIDTIAGTHTINGSYMLKALPAGSYTLAFVPGDVTYKEQTRPGINVTVNNVTTVENVTLVQ